MVKRMTGPNAISAHRLSNDIGVSQQSLSRWRQDALSLAYVTEPKKKRRRTKTWTVDEKLRVLTAASRLSDGELGELLRREGLHEAQLKEWRRALEDGTAASNATKHVRALERELRRKEKALAEVAALLVLKKKARALLGDEDDDTIEGGDE